MSRLSLGGNRLAITADVPAPIAGVLRTIKRSYRTLAPGSQDRLVLSDSLPSLSLTPRDPREAISFLPAPAAEAAGGEQGSSEDVPSIWWYHTIELPDGTCTPGFYDHRPLLPHYGLPADLTGKRVLDVATFDGFWAFEFERRGATVVATDIERASQLNLPPQARAALLEDGLDQRSGAGFRLAHKAIGSRVERRICDVYDLDPSTLGVFDLVHVADLLLHLERPLEALRAVRRVTADRAFIVDCFDPALAGTQTTRYLGGWSGAVWWLPSLDTLAQMVIDAGFARVDLKLVYSLGSRTEPTGHWRAALVAHV